MAKEAPVQYDFFSNRDMSEESLPVIEIPTPEPHPVVVKLPTKSREMGAIEDAGQELVANRRNRIKKAHTWADIAQLNDALKVKEAVKGNVWMKPDYAALIENGMQPFIAHLYKQVYDSIAASPAVGASVKLDDAVLQKYLSGLNRVEHGLNKWTRDRDALKAWAETNMRVAGAELGRVIAVSDLLPTQSLMHFVYPDGWKLHREELKLIGGNKLLVALQPGMDEAKRASKALANGWPSKRETWEIQGFKVLAHPNVLVEKMPYSASFIMHVGPHFAGTFKTIEDAEAAKAAVQPFVLSGKRGLVGSYSTEELAIEAAKGLTVKKVRGEVVGDKGIRVEAAVRIGPVRRLEGEDISSERLMLEFGFKGVNFGNWMKTPSARLEAQLHLNHAFDAMHDLAEIMGAPPRAMSLNGMLGLAIGAQGNGGRYAAHFVPGVNEINLTREAGAGAVGHEWAHAVDHYFATMGGLATHSTPFLSEHAGLGPMRATHRVVAGKIVEEMVPRFGELRPEVVSAFQRITETMNKRQQSIEEANAAGAASLAKSEKSVAGWLKSIRRDFDGLESAFDAFSAKVQAGSLGDGKIAAGSSAYLSPALAEIREVYKSKHGRLYSLDNMKALQANLEMMVFRRDLQTEPQKPASKNVSTDFAMHARALDDEKGGKPYWSTTIEKFARSFDAFLSDELEKRCAKNSYLSFTGRKDRTVPMGTERVEINAAFSNLVNTIEVRETAKGPVLCSLLEDGIRAPMPRSAIESEIRRLQGQWPKMPRVTVVETTAELPFEISSKSDGAYFDHEVYIIASNVADLKSLQKAMAHECILHHSLEEMLGSYGFSKLHAGIQSLKERSDPTVKAIAENVYSRYGPLTPEIETKEIVARAGELCLDDKGEVKVNFGFMKSVFAGVAGWLRDHGIPVGFTNVELQGLMHDAGEWIKGGADHKRSPLGKEAPKGWFSGKVLGISDGVVTQRTGRSGETMEHALSSLSQTVAVGDIVDIQYRDGRGQVSERQPSLDRGR